MEDMLNELRSFTSRNEFWTVVVIPDENLEELAEVIEKYDYAYYEVEEKFTDEEGLMADVLITVDLDEWSE